jgi:hypothetical protein
MSIATTVNRIRSHSSSSVGVTLPHSWHPRTVAEPAALDPEHWLQQRRRKLPWQLTPFHSTQSFTH